jgi:hypothetical protein
MKSISKEIYLDWNEMNDTPTSAYSLVYKDENFFYKEKRHSVPSLLRLGFLCCRHASEEQ